MSDQITPASPPWREFPRFSVRGLMVVVLLIGAALGWWVRSARIQREAVAAILDAGGAVNYGWDDAASNAIAEGPFWVPRWIVDHVGVDYFGHVTGIVLDPSSSATDAVIVQVGRLTSVEQLSLEGSSHRDAELAHVEGLANLSGLFMNGARVSDAGLVHLKRLTNLFVLNLDHTQVSGAGLVHLNGLTNFSVLSLDGTQVTDAGLASLKGLTKLTGLSLNGTQVTDAGLANLKGLTKLTDLGLKGTQVTGAGIKELQKALPRLTIYR